MESGNGRSHPLQQDAEQPLDHFSVELSSVSIPLLLFAGTGAPGHVRPEPPAQRAHTAAPLRMPPLLPTLWAANSDNAATRPQPAPAAQRSRACLWERPAPPRSTLLACSQWWPARPPPRPPAAAAGPCRAALRWRGAPARARCQTAGCRGGRSAAAPPGPPAPPWRPNGTGSPSNRAFVRLGLLLAGAGDRAASDRTSVYETATPGATLKLHAA